MIRTLIADDHALFRQGLRHILEDLGDVEVVAEASTGLEAVEECARLQPALAILDIGMKELNGIEAASQIRRRSPRTAVLILSMHDDERYVLRAAKAGASGYLLKDAVGDDLQQAIRAVARGGSYYGPSAKRVLEERNALPAGEREVEDRYELLTERERQLYHLLAEGNRNKEIATRLNLSLHTVETHRTRIMEKLGVHNIAELLLGAVKRGHIVPQ